MQEIELSPRLLAPGRYLSVRTNGYDLRQPIGRWNLATTEARSAQGLPATNSRRVFGIPLAAHRIFRKGHVRRGTPWTIVLDRLAVRG